MRELRLREQRNLPEAIHTVISSGESRDLNPDPLASRASALTTRLQNLGWRGCRAQESRQKDPESRTPGTAGTLPSAPCRELGCVSRVQWLKWGHVSRLHSSYPKPVPVNYSK